MKFYTFSFLFIFFFLNVNAQTTTLINSGSVWKYLDNGSDQGSAWFMPGFNDASWASGNAELGYGDGDESTVVGYGPNSSNKFITTYFRKTFNVINPSVFSSLNLQLVRDDGAVVFINGVEVWRSNMPSGSISYTTNAPSTISWPFEDDWHSITISAAHLVAGTNTIAVEIHQDSPSSSDISFNLKLEGVMSPINANIVRGPYLQKATSGSIIIKWRTDVPCDSKVNYGTNSTTLLNFATNTTFSTEHEVEILGLSPYTKYYYNVGMNSSVLLNASSDLYFVTLPLEGALNPYRFWVIGDAGTGNSNQRDVRDAFLTYNNGEHIDGWLWLGDNAYEGGKDNEYQDNVFTNEYENIMKNTVVWPTPGNHDYNNHIPFSPSPAYYDIFTLPKNAEAGGVPSGTEKYYSFNVGNIHFVSLDSYDENRSTSGAMATWLQADLMSNALPWLIVFFHHPPYTKGSHDSDNPLLYDFEMVDMREKILPILENFGADLVLCGHSHSYERSKFMDSHYGYSNSLTPAMIIDGGSGNYYAGDCAYTKNTTVNKAHKGTVYAVVGCSGKTQSVSSGWPHPVMYSYSFSDLGSMLLEINDNRLDAKFIKTNGNVFDAFSIFKNVGKNDTIELCAGENVVLKPSFNGLFNWLPMNVTSDSLSISVTANTTVYATDINGCIADTFNLQLLPYSNCGITTNVSSTNSDNFSFESIVEGNQFVLNIVGCANSKLDISIYDVLGKQVALSGITCNSGSISYSIEIENYNTGIYFLQIKTENKIITKKIFIQH